MQNAPNRADSPHRRVQFTVRTFFAAAVLVSLFAAATNLPGQAAKQAGILFVIWLAFAGMYRVFRATAPLVALPVGTALSATCWGLTLPFVRADFPRLSELVPTAFFWGIVASIMVVLSGVLRGTVGRLTGRSSRASLGESESRQDSMKPARAALGSAGYVLVIRILLAILLGAAAAFFIVPKSQWPPGTLAKIDAILDTPLAPLIAIIFGSAPVDSLLFLLTTAPLYCALHAGTGWIVGFVAAKIVRRAAETGGVCGDVGPEQEPGACEPSQPS